jgi:hypothetical protein
MSEEVAALKFEGTTVVGCHRRVSIDLLTGKLKARLAPDAKPVCYINLPLSAGSDTDAQISGNPCAQLCTKTLDALLCAAHDGVEIIAHGDAVLLPLEWLYTEYPTRRKLWEVQRDALHRYARKNGLRDRPDLPGYFISTWIGQA